MSDPSTTEEIVEEVVETTVTVESEIEVTVEINMDPSNLNLHAKRELTIMDVDEEDIEKILKIMDAFAEMGLSGSGAAFFIPMITDLLNFKNLTPLTDAPVEWIEIADGLHQSVRCAEAFSETGGRTYYLLSEREYYNRAKEMGTPEDQLPNIIHDSKRIYPPDKG